MFGSDERRDVFADDVRPYWSERSEPVGTPATHWRRDHGTERAATYEQHRQWRIADGVCPMPGCHTDLEEPGSDAAYCRECGWSLTEDRMRERVKAREPAVDYLDVFPGALRIPYDEFGPAQVDEEAA